jgi:hypothetical protein
MAAGLTYEKIATTTLGAATSEVTFSSIPNTYTDLRCVMNGYGNNYFGLRLNGDTTTTYSCHTFRGLGNGTLTGTSNIDFTYMNASAPNGLGIGQPVLWTIDIFSYAGSTHKTAIFEGAMDYNTALYGGVWKSAGLWRSTAAINSVTFYAGGGSPQQIGSAGTTFTIYGIKNA